MNVAKRKQHRSQKSESGELQCGDNRGRGNKRSRKQSNTRMRSGMEDKRSWKTNPHLNSTHRDLDPPDPFVEGAPYAACPSPPAPACTGYACMMLANVGGTCGEPWCAIVGVWYGERCITGERDACVCPDVDVDRPERFYFYL